MKILYVTTISDTVNTFLIPHIELLTEQGHRVDVAFNIVQEVSSELIELGCKVHNLEFQRSPLKRQNYIAYKKLKKIICDEKYDLVHTHTPVASACVRLVCRKMKNVKVFYTAHGFHFFKGAPVLNWLLYYPIEKWLANYTDCLITTNNEDYQRAKDRFKSKSIKHVNGVGVDINNFKPQTYEMKNKLRKEHGYNQDNFILVFAGELSYRKHQDLLIDAIDLLKKTIPNIRLLLAGVGDLSKQYQARVNKLEVEENVIFLGYRKDLADILTLSDIAVSSSRQEGLPVNIMMAMATGLPLVATNCRGNCDLVIDGKGGCVVGVDDVKGFADAVERLYASEELRKQFGENNLLIIEKYSLNNIIKEMEEVYRTYLD